MIIFNNDYYNMIKFYQIKISEVWIYKINFNLLIKNQINIIKITIYTNLLQ